MHFFISVLAGLQYLKIWQNLNYSNIQAFQGSKVDVNLLIDWLGLYARFVDHLAVRNVAEGTPLGGRSALHRPEPYRMLCSLHQPMNRNHLGQCTALSDRTVCER